MIIEAPMSVDIPATGALFVCGLNLVKEEN
jgi:hypothetical protein